MYKNIHVRVRVLFAAVVLGAFLLSPVQSPVINGDCPGVSGTTCGG